MYPGGQIGSGLAVLGGDPRSTVGAGSEAAELGGSADGTETTSAWTVMGATNPKTRAKVRIGTTILCMWVLSSAPMTPRPVGGLRLTLEASMQRI